MIKRDDVLWMAGYLEGEGSFHYVRASKAQRGKACPQPRPLYPVIGVVSTDKDVIEKVCCLTGSAMTGPYTRQNKPLVKPIYRSTVTGPNARGWMMMIYPFMGERRKAKIKSVLAQWRDQ